VLGKGIGKLTGDESIETTGEALDEGATEGITGMKDIVKSIFD